MSNFQAVTPEMSTREREFRYAFADFENAFAGFLEDPALHEVALNRARARVLHLYVTKEAQPKSTPKPSGCTVPFVLVPNRRPKKDLTP